MSKRTIVTGASSGIGTAAVRSLAGAGWQILAVARRQDRLDQLHKELGDQVVPCAVDVTAEDAPDRIMASAEAELGGLDLLVNNAGGSWVGSFVDMPVADLDRVFDLNVRAVMRLCQAAVPLLSKSTNGHIINVSSVAADLPMESLVAYCTSKAAVTMFSRVLAKELAGQRIRVNVLSPCGTDTEIFEKVGVDVDPAALVSAEDMAALILTLVNLPAGLDVADLAVHKRFEPL